ncbi:MAG: hypothetical protein KIT47_20900, partial [Rhodoferax sp.]|nr:hypothetical protein [Rhodoferax sp.]
MAVLERAVSVPRARSQGFSALITREIGKSIAQSQGEVAMGAIILDCYADHAGPFLAPEKVACHICPSKRDGARLGTDPEPAPLVDASKIRSTHPRPEFPMPATHPTQYHKRPPVHQHHPARSLAH